LGIEPRKGLEPERRDCPRMSKATLLSAKKRRVRSRVRAVIDPRHVRKHIEREPGEPVVAR